MTNKAPYCAFGWLTITVLSRQQIKARPKGLHNFAFYILIFDFLSPFALIPFPFSLTPRPSSLTPNPSPLAPNVIVRKFLRLYICRDKITDVMSALQIHLFMQNEPNFRKVKSNVNKVLTKDYVQMDTWSIRKNEPKTNPNEPKTNPILADKTPIRTQTNPIQTQTNPIYPVVAPGEAGTKPISERDLCYRTFSGGGVWSHLRLNS